MSREFLIFLYLVASVCFILALRGLSSPQSARTGHWIGVAGMVLAVGSDSFGASPAQFFRDPARFERRRPPGAFLCAPDSDDGFAAACGGVSLFSGSRGGFWERARLF